MIKEPKAMREIHAIREKLHTEQKNLSTEELIFKIRREVTAMKKKYGIKLKSPSTRSAQ